MQLDVAHNVVDGLGHVGDVLFTQAADGSSAGLKQVDVILVFEGMNLRRGEAGVGEHSILFHNVSPGPRGLQPQKLVIESLSH